MGTGFNGGEINTSVTEVDFTPPPSHLLSGLYAGDRRLRLMALKPIDAYKTYSQTKVLYPAGL